jgi:hypothetical protein
MINNNNEKYKLFLWLFIFFKKRTFNGLLFYSSYLYLIYIVYDMIIRMLYFLESLLFVF